MEDKFAILEATGPLTDAQKMQESAKSSVGALIPYATTYTSSDNLGAYQKQKIYKPSGANDPINKFTDFVGAFGSQVGGLAAGAGGFLWDTTMTAIKAPISLISSPFEEINISNKITANMNQQKSNQAKMDSLIKAFKAGTISKTEYQAGLSDVIKENEILRKDAEKNVKDSEKNLSDTGQEAMDTALDVVTVICAVGSGGLSTIVPTLAKSTSVEAVTPVIKFFGRKEVSLKLMEASIKIDDVVNATTKVVNKIGTLNGRMPAGQLVRIVDATIKDGAANLTAKQISKNIAVGLLIKRPLIYQTNVGLATDIYKDLLKGDVNGAVLSTLAVGGMALSGGPIGLALETLGKGTKWLKTASYYSKSNVSRDSFFDALSSKIGAGDKGQFAREFAKRAAKGSVDDIKFGNIMADVNMQMAGGDSNVAADLIINWYKSSSSGAKLIADGNVSKIIDDLIGYASMREELVQNAVKAGMPAALAKRLVLGRANSVDKLNIVKILSKVDEAFVKKGKMTPEAFEELKSARLEQLGKLIDREGGTAAWANNETFIGELEDAINFSKTTKGMTKRINKIETGRMFKGKLSKGFREKMSKGGYIPLEPHDTYTPYVGLNEAGNKIKTEFASEGPDLFEQAVKPLPMLSGIVGAMTKVGLSPQASQDAVHKVFQDNFDNLIKQSPELVGMKVGQRTMRNGKDIMSKLYSYVRTYNAGSVHFIRPITDIRQITKREIMTALHCSEDQSRQVMRALNSSMLQVPRDLRGLGDKIQDFNLKYNPMAAWYSRTQGTFRYTINPFFKIQQATQTEYLSQIEAGTKSFQVPGWNTLNKHMFDKEGVKRNEEVIQLLQKKNIFAQGFTGEGFSGDVFAELGNRVIKSEKISMAGLIQKQAKVAGYDDIERYIDENYSSVLDTLRVITMTNTAKDIFDSPLGRTINTAFFPFRFNMKVANVMVKQMSKLNAPTQVALISSLMDAGQWLESDDGLAWQTQYADAIAMFNWITPTYPLAYVQKLAKDVVDPENAAVGDLGLLGGLPFGMISQVLEANGVITASAAYMNPKTGDVYPRYAPSDTASEVNLAMQSFIGSLFSYPGSLFGLPSKTSMIKSVTSPLVGGQYGFEQVSREGDMTPEQLRKQEAIRKYNGQPIKDDGTVKNTVNVVTKVPMQKTPGPDQTAISRKLSKTKTRSKVLPRPISRP